MKLDTILDMVKKAAVTEYTSTKTDKTSQKQPVDSVHYTKKSGLSLGVEDTTVNKKSILEGLEALEKSDLDTQRDFMVVMSNTMSQSDFQEMMKEGYSLGDSEIEHIVTVVDKIKIKLAQAGIDNAYTRDVSLQDMADVLGSEGRAIQVASNLGKVDVAELEQDSAVLEEAPVDPMFEFTYEVPEQSEDMSQLQMDASSETVTDTKQMPEFIFRDTRVQTEEELYSLITTMLVDNDLPVTKENVDGIVQSLQLALDITDLSENAKKFMLENELEPTIMNFYRAEFSSKDVDNSTKPGYYTDTMPGYYAKKSQNINWQAIQGQMERIIQQADIPVNEDTLAKAKWLVQQGIPLTPETLSNYIALEDITFPLQAQDILESIITGMKEGLSPKNTELNDKEDKVAKAIDICQKLHGISEEALQHAVRSGQLLTLENLSKQQKVVEENKDATFIYSNAKETGEDSAELITAKRQLEEVRLMMTVQVSVRMLKLGIDVGTKELSELVEDLRQVEGEYQKSVFEKAGVPYTQKAGRQFAETSQKIEDLKTMPMYALGGFASGEQQSTLRQIHQQGAVLQNSMEAANLSYETMMTVPRSDMGDSIYKAFQNVDDILQSLSLEPTQSNQRAVKILAFNRMPLTMDNIMKVKEADTCVNRLMENMTGEVTLELIRKGKNPLDTDIYQLNDEVEDIKSKLGDSMEEKYSEFLWRAEKNNNITENERNAYIGIYRLFHQIEKSQGSVVGALVAQGAEITLANLISGVKTMAAKNINVKVDDTFGGVTSGKSDITPMKEQIEEGFSQGENSQENSSDSGQSYSDRQKQQQYYNTLIKQVTEEIKPEKLAQIPQAGTRNYTLENFYDMLRNLPEDQQIQREVYEEKMSQIQKARTVENNVIKMLLDYQQPVTLNNLAAANSLMNERGKMIKRLMTEATKSPKKNKEKEILTAAERVTDNLISKEAAEAAYNDLTDAEEEVVQSALQQQNLEYVDIRSLQLLHQQIQLTRGLSREENYEIPVEINNEVTSINLKIIRGSHKDGNVSITMECEAYGKIAASFHVKADRITGLMVSDTDEGCNFLRSCDRNIRIGMAGESYRVTKLNYAKSDSVDLNQFSEIERAKGTSDVNTSALYQCARTFIGIVRTQNRG